MSNKTVYVIGAPHLESHLAEEEC